MTTQPDPLDQSFPRSTISSFSNKGSTSNKVTICTLSAPSKGAVAMQQYYPYFVYLVNIMHENTIPLIRRAHRGGFGAVMLSTTHITHQPAEFWLRRGQSPSPPPLRTLTSPSSRRPGTCKLRRGCRSAPLPSAPLPAEDVDHGVDRRLQ